MQVNTKENLNDQTRAVSALVNFVFLKVAEVQTAILVVLSLAIDNSKNILYGGSALPLILAIVAFALLVAESFNKKKMPQGQFDLRQFLEYSKLDSIFESCVNVLLSKLLAFNCIFAILFLASVSNELVALEFRMMGLVALSAILLVSFFSSFYLSQSLARKLNGVSQD